MITADGEDRAFSPDNPLMSRTDHALRALTAGQVVLGFMSYRGRFMESAVSSLRSRTLFRRQLAEVEDLQGQLDRGEISANRFADRIEGMIGDAVPYRVFVGFEFWGSPVRRCPRGRLGRYLALDTVQQEVARTIFRHLHADIELYRRHTHQWMREVLTARQLRGVESMSDESLRGGARCADWVGIPLLQRMIGRLGLHGVQEAEINVCRALLRREICELHQAARGRFCNILNPAQADTLRAIERSSPSC
jgi:hypothetical protein